MTQIVKNEIFQGGAQPTTPMYCNSRMTPVILAGALVEVTKYIYKQQERLLPSVWPWLDNKTERTVYITETGDWEDNKVGMRPAIIVDVGDIQYDSSVYQGLDGQMHYDLRRGESVQARRCVCSVVFAHLAKTYAQARLYATNSLDLLDAFNGAIQSDLGFENVETRGIFRPTQRKEEPEDWMARVQLDLQWQETFSVRDDAPTLKQVTLTTDFLNQSFNQVQ